jgi:hypothetical protein
MSSFQAEGRQDVFTDQIDANPRKVAQYLIENWAADLHAELVRHGWKVKRLREDGNAIIHADGGISPSAKARDFMRSCVEEAYCGEEPAEAWG